AALGLPLLAEAGFFAAEPQADRVAAARTSAAMRSGAWFVTACSSRRVFTYRQRRGKPSRAVASVAVHEADRLSQLRPLDQRARVPRAHRGPRPAAARRGGGGGRGDRDRRRLPACPPFRAPARIAVSAAVGDGG